ncbi:MAG TPA: MFS transporter [Rhizomicrobium sp.]|jgi:ACS family hexuronate transporter-like MFS transporter|nr:MFS transporter [Rhizomicrobium sp.]
MRRFFGIRWLTIALIMVGAMVNFLSRATLAVAAPTVMQSLHITTEQYGWITGAFQGFIMLQPVVGYIIDILGVKTGFALFAFAWSAICMAHGFATNWQILAGLRGLLGFAEGAFSPGGLKVVSEWFPARERGLAGGLYNIGPSIGQMLAPPLVVWAILNYDWQAAFVIVGLISLVWVVLWLIFYYPVARHPALSAQERELILSGQENYLKSDEKKPSVGHILKQRNFWGIAMPRFLADPTWGMLSFWVPLYLTTIRHFDLKHIAMYAWLPFLAADLGCVFGPAVALFLQKRGLDLIDARRGAFTTGAVMMIGVAFAGVVQNPYVAVALISLAGFAHQTLSVTIITMATDLFRHNEVGTVAGMAGTCANFGILISSLLIGGLVSTIGYEPFFASLAALDIAAAIVVWTVIRKPATNA